MHRKNEGLFFKGKDKKTDLVYESNPKKENHDKATSSSEVCGMSYLSGHSIGNFSVHKADHMKFVTTAVGKDKEGGPGPSQDKQKRSLLQGIKKGYGCMEKIFK